MVIRSCQGARLPWLVLINWREFICTWVDTLFQRMPCLVNSPFSVDFELLRKLYSSPECMEDAVKEVLSGMRFIVTGGAGFVGSHLVDRLLLLGAHCIIIDDLSTGSFSNISHWRKNPNFTFIQSDISEASVDMAVDGIFHLASPASPIHYQENPVKTITTNVSGTRRVLEIAECISRKYGNPVPFILASTSEVYGDPEVHPQREDYLGAVSTIGPRACYDEGKRCAEALTSIYSRRNDNLACAILRIFNTYGPRMQRNDGRVVSNFINQALSGRPLTVYSDGIQTRSFQFIHDLIDAFVATWSYLRETRDKLIVMNIGCPQEQSIEDFAMVIKQMLDKPALCIVYEEKPKDDPKRRRPDISKAMECLQWTPRWTLQAGLKETIEFYQAPADLHRKPHEQDEL